MNMSRHTKTYRDENGEAKRFDREKFRSIIKSNQREKGMTQSNYVDKLAKGLSCSADTIEGWRKGRNAPQDIETVYALEKELELSNGALLYSETDNLRKEVQYYKQEKEKLEVELNKAKKQVESMKKNFTFTERTQSFCLRYDGFSNIIDMLIGVLYGDIDKPSTYAEELSYILSDNTYENSITEILGYHDLSEDEIRLALEEFKDKPPEEFDRWMYDSVIDSNGHHLYNENKKINLHKMEIWERIKESAKLKKADRRRAGALLNELIEKWGKMDFPYAMCAINIQICEDTIARFRFGEGYVNPTHSDRMDVITELLFLSNGRIDTYTFENAVKFHVDQFEMEVEVTFDLARG